MSDYPKAIEGPHSTVVILSEEGPVWKRPTAFLEFGIVARELQFLGQLSGHEPVPPVPRRICSDRDAGWLLLSYCGEPLVADNLPDDWMEQGQDLLRALKKHHTSHNDIRPGNLLVKDGRIYLIDFAWATLFKDEISDDWPANLGGAYRLGDHQFDDSYSLWKSLEAIRDGKA